MAVTSDVPVAVESIGAAPASCKGMSESHRDTSTSDPSVSYLNLPTNANLENSTDYLNATRHTLRQNSSFRDSTLLRVIRDVPAEQLRSAILQFCDHIPELESLIENPALLRAPFESSDLDRNERKLNGWDIGAEDGAKLADYENRRSEARDDMLKRFGTNNDKESANLLLQLYNEPRRFRFEESTGSAHPRENAEVELSFETFCGVLNLVELSNTIVVTKKKFPRGGRKYSYIWEVHESS